MTTRSQVPVWYWQSLLKAEYYLQDHIDIFHIQIKEKKDNCQPVVLFTANKKTDQTSKK
jgi:hypothetical protein